MFIFEEYGTFKSSSTLEQITANTSHVKDAEDNNIIYMFQQCLYL